MSTYQYYEFRAIDRPLTEEQQKEVSSYSSRADVNSYRASFVYNYGDFRGNEDQLMENCFDVMLYMASWGTRRLIFRFPVSLIDLKKIAPFCISEEIDHYLSSDEKYIILDLNFREEDGWDDWLEGEGWLDEMIDLREELINGDFRVLYLAWLRAARKAFDYEYVDEETIEPPVPAGLKTLTRDQKAYARFLDLDEAMIEVAAEQSTDLQNNEEIDRGKLIIELSVAEKFDFLLRLSNNEKNLSVLLNRRLSEIAGEESSQKQTNPVERRTISELIELAKQWYQKEKEKEKKKAELARRKELELLATRKNKAWSDVYKFIEERKSSSYDKALNLIKDLHELSILEKNVSDFKTQLERVQDTYSSRPAMLRRIKDAKI